LGYSKEVLKGGLLVAEFEDLMDVGTEVQGILILRLLLIVVYIFELVL